MEKHSALHLEHLGDVAFARLFTEKGMLHCSTFMNACGSHILDVSRMSKAREVRSELIPVSHGNPHPTCILSQRMCCNEHIYHNLHAKGHNAQDVECFCTLINSIFFKIIKKKKRQKHKHKAASPKFASLCDTIFCCIARGLNTVREAKPKNQHRNQHF